MTGKPKILILGAGFAGVGLFQELCRLFKPEECEITVVDENNFSLYTPMLTEVAGGTVEASHVVAPVRALAGHAIRFEQGRVEKIDVDQKSVSIAVGAPKFGIPDATRQLEFDYLAIALGSVTNYHHIAGLEDHSMPAKQIEDAMEIRSRSLALLARAGEEPDAEQRRRFLTFVVGGGGFSGVETMAALNDMVRTAAGNYPNVVPDDIRCIIIQPGSRLLPEIGESLAAYTQHELEERGVEVLLDTKVTGAGENWVELQGKDDKEPRRIETYTLIWAGGVTPSPVIHSSGLKMGKHGGIEVDSTCAVPDHPSIWALGDCAEIPQPGKNKTYAPTAQNAIREGAQVARNIAAAIRGGKQEPFVYTPIGELAIVGNRVGVASVFGLQFKGIVAWMMWRSVYLTKLPRFPQRVRVALDWLLAAASGRETAQLETGRSRRA